MIAHARLWIDDDGVLCDAPPSGGVMIATAGAEVPPRFVIEHRLTERDGKVVQQGHGTRHPKSKEAAIFADRQLYVGKDGVLSDVKPVGGMAIAAEGEKISPHYVQAYNLTEKDGKVVQKRKPKTDNKASTPEEEENVKKEDAPNKAEKKPPNKQADTPPNKSGGGGLTITTPEGVEHSSKGA